MLQYFPNSTPQMVGKPDLLDVAGRNLEIDVHAPHRQAARLILSAQGPLSQLLVPGVVDHERSGPVPPPNIVAVQGLRKSAGLMTFGAQVRSDHQVPLQQLLAEGVPQPRPPDLLVQLGGVVLNVPLGTVRLRPAPPVGRPAVPRAGLALPLLRPDLAARSAHLGYGLGDGARVPLAAELVPLVDVHAVDEVDADGVATEHGRVEVDVADLLAGEEADHGDVEPVGERDGAVRLGARREVVEIDLVLIVLFVVVVVFFVFVAFPFDVRLVPFVVLDLRGGSRPLHLFQPVERTRRRPGIELQVLRPLQHVRILFGRRRRRESPGNRRRGTQRR
mmetsp:Transcript_8339/g.17699  ORF Transcript_8339/g.17699 Transcript_8339/m.17699 type:complete len:333 (+) Transcript_8339:172-1170(+)